MRKYVYVCVCVREIGTIIANSPPIQPQQCTKWTIYYIPSVLPTLLPPRSERIRLGHLAKLQDTGGYLHHDVSRVNRTISFHLIQKLIIIRNSIFLKHLNRYTYYLLTQHHVRSILILKVIRPIESSAYGLELGPYINITKLSRNHRNLSSWIYRV